MPRLYNWYIDEHSLGYALARGVVTGHSKLEDSTYVHTSIIEDFNIVDEVNNIAIIKTRNNSYEVKLSDINMEKMSKDLTKYSWSNKILDFIRKYTKPEDFKYNVPEQSILLVLGNNREYYFDRMIVNNADDQLEIRDATPHIGMVQDSVLCDAYGDELEYDIRYFTYKGNNIEFYSWHVHNLCVYIHNCGDSELRAELEGCTYVIKPNETIEITEENKSNQKLTSRSDLYTSW